MKLSVSLPEADVAFLDEYAGRLEEPSRSAVVHRAIALLRESQLESAYTSAWQEWDESLTGGTGETEAALWDRTVADGLADATR